MDKSTESKINLTHLIMTVALLVGGFSFVFELRESLAVQKQEVGQLERRLNRAEIRNKEDFAQIMDSIARLEAKVDRILIANRTSYENVDS
jgi:hypothetical protein